MGKGKPSFKLMRAKRNFSDILNSSSPLEEWFKHIHRWKSGPVSKRYESQPWLPWILQIRRQIHGNTASLKTPSSNLGRVSRLYHYLLPSSPKRRKDEPYSKILGPLDTNSIFMTSGGSLEHRACTTWWTLRVCKQWGETKHMPWVRGWSGCSLYGTSEEPSFKKVCQSVHQSVFF